MTTEQAIQEFGLPPETVQFLSEGRQFDYDSSKCKPGKISLRPFAELRLRKAWVDPSELPNFAVWNPHSEETGYYEVPCVSLCLKAEGYKPDGILVWIPKLKLFATCDAGHGIIWLFPEASWSKIVEDPVAYLAAQWNVNPELQALLVPWGLFPFKVGNPYDDSEVITS